MCSCGSVGVFVALNIADAWLTRELLAHGGKEGNPIVSAYGSNIFVKGALALAVALLLTRFAPRLIRLLSLCMVLVVLWTGGWLLAYL